MDDNIKNMLPNTVDDLNAMIRQQNQQKKDENDFKPMDEILPGVDPKNLNPEDMNFEIDKKGRIKYKNEEENDEEKEKKPRMPSEIELKAYFNSLSPREKVKRGFATTYKQGITKATIKSRKINNRKKNKQATSSRKRNR